MLPDKFLLPSEPKKAVHSQKVAINIKITLLNNKYLMNMETLICLKSQAIPSFNQLTHFRAVKMQLRKHAGEEQHTLYNSLCTSLLRNNRPFALQRVSTPDSLTELAGIHDYSYFWRLKRKLGFGKTDFLSAPYII